MERFVKERDGLTVFDLEEFLKASKEAQIKAGKAGIDPEDIETFIMKEVGFESKIEYRSKLHDAYSAQRIARYNQIKDLKREGKTNFEIAKELDMNEYLVSALVENEDNRRAEAWIKRYGDAHKKARESGISEEDTTDYVMKELGYKSKKLYFHDMHDAVKTRGAYIINWVTDLHENGKSIDEIVKITKFDEKLVKSIVEGKKED